MSLDSLTARIVAALSDDLRRAPWRGSSNPLAGHCYVASEAAWHALGGASSDWLPCFIKHEGAPHWFLRERSTGRVLDITASQFATPPAYELGRGKGFLTREPSKRASVVLSSINRGTL